MGPCVPLPFSAGLSESSGEGLSLGLGAAFEVDDGVLPGAFSSPGEAAVSPSAGVSVCRCRGPGEMARTGSDKGLRRRDVSFGVWLGEGESDGVGLSSGEADGVGTGDSSVRAEGDGRAEGEGLGEGFFFGEAEGVGEVLCFR